MKPCLLISLFAVLLLFSCGKTTHTENVSEDESMVDSSAISEAVPDPDPTDQIPGDQYLVDANSEKTAAVVRDRLMQLLESDLKIGIVDSLSRKFIFFEYDLNGDGSKEIFVGLTGPYFCGSGGCTQYILNAKGEVISKFTVSDYPVVISREQTNSWNDLYILTGGQYHVAKFTGNSYPGNPSVLPKLANVPGDDLPRALDFLNDNYPWFRF